VITTGDHVDGTNGFTDTEAGFSAAHVAPTGRTVVLQK
jgi:hypothetical protein